VTAAVPAKGAMRMAATEAGPFVRRRLPGSQAESHPHGRPWTTHRGRDVGDLNCASVVFNGDGRCSLECILVGQECFFEPSQVLQHLRSS
jgi:hypothetical protein